METKTPNVMKFVPDRLFVPCRFAVDGPALRQAREMAGMSVKECASYIGVTRSYLSKCEEYTGFTVTAEVAKKVLEVLRRKRVSTDDDLGC